MQKIITIPAALQGVSIEANIHRISCRAHFLKTSSEETTLCFLYLWSILYTFVVGTFSVLRYTNHYLAY